MTHRLVLGDSLAVLRGMKDDSAALVCGSPPYPEKGERYGKSGGKWPAPEWVDWMVDILRECVRVSSGWTVMVVNGPVKEGRYLGAIERLIVRLIDDGAFVLDRTLIWQKNCPPNRHVGNAWWANSYEQIVAVRSATKKARPINAQAIGTPMKYDSGGDFRQRGTDGKRRKGGKYPTGKLAYPRDVIYATVGGGHMGHPLAHKNEAPYPETLVTPLVLALSDAGEIVLDPFMGSGTTAAVASKNSRQSISIDFRASQIKLASERLADIGCIVETTTFNLKG